MKYIFRYAILTQYTNNSDNLKPDDLVSILKSVKFTQMDQIQALLQISRATIDALIKNMGKSTQSGSDAVKQIIALNFGPQNESSYPDLAQVWQNQKQQIINKMLMQSTKSQSKLSRIAWQINNQITTKLDSQKQKSIVLNFYSINSDKQTQKSTVQLNKKQLNELSTILFAAAQFLDQNLQ